MCTDIFAKQFWCQCLENKNNTLLQCYNSYRFYCKIPHYWWTLSYKKQGFYIIDSIIRETPDCAIKLFCITLSLMFILLPDGYFTCEFVLYIDNFVELRLPFFEELHPDLTAKSFFQPLKKVFVRINRLFKD